jgi:hypothetical protein
LDFSPANNPDLVSLRFCSRGVFQVAYAVSLKKSLVPEYAGAHQKSVPDNLKARAS